MNCAIYARKSTEQNGVVDESKSVARQVEHARAYAERIVEPQEAAVVRRIFDMATAGAGFKRIAMALNDDGAIAPVPRRAGRPRGWSPSTVRDVIYRDLYSGIIVWTGARRP